MNSLYISDLAPVPLGFAAITPGRSGMRGPGVLTTERGDKRAPGTPRLCSTRCP